MALKIGDNFSYQGQKPNFDRDSFDTLAAMKAFPETSIDEGHISYCKEDGKNYQYKSANSIDATTGKWREFISGEDVYSIESYNLVVSDRRSRSLTEEQYNNLKNAIESSKIIIGKTSSGQKIVYNNISLFEPIILITSYYGSETIMFSTVLEIYDDYTYNYGSKTTYVVPHNGTKNQVLTKTGNTEDTYAWADLPEINALPEGGITGQVLKKTASGTEWADDKDTTYSVATTSSNGLMSSDDKQKVDVLNISGDGSSYLASDGTYKAIQSSGSGDLAIDSILSPSSTNPVQNKIIYDALSGKAELNHTHVISNITDLQSTLNNKANSSHTHSASSITGLSSVATSGSYNDLINKPDIPEQYTLPTASSSVLGGVKLGYQLNGKKYPVQLDSDDKAYVEVNWTDTNTTYSNATSSTAGLMSPEDKKKLDGISEDGGDYVLPSASSNSLGGIKVGYTESEKNYAVKLDSSSKAYVSVPWVNTTYSNATTSTAGLMSAADKTKLDGITGDGSSDYILPAANTNDLGGIKIGYSQTGSNYPVELDNDNKAYVNIPIDSLIEPISTESINSLIDKIIPSN